MTTHHHRTPLPAAVPPAADRLPGPLALALRELSATVALPTTAGGALKTQQTLAAAILTLRAADPAFDLNPDLRALRRALAERIEADIATLDMLGGDPDLEDGCDAEPSLGSLGGPQYWWSRGGTDDREDGDDTGIGDVGGLAEQCGRHLRLIVGGAR